MLNFLATRNQDQMAAKQRIVAVIKAKMFSPQRRWKSIKRRTDAFVVESKGTVFDTVQRKRISKILPKSLMFYQMERRKKKMLDVPPYAIYGVRLEIKVL